jgi:hypothetical protein
MMPSFHDFVMRHGEHGAQALVEKLERYEGIRVRMGVTLEQRWNEVMQPAGELQRMAA